MNPHLSAEENLTGAFYSNPTPLVLSGTRVLIFEGLNKRHMFAQHGVEGWYWGPAPEHYQCYTVYVPTTLAERTVKTVEYPPHNCPVPKLLSTDVARQVVEYLAEALNNPAPASLFAVEY